ncbi:MAG: M48 family metalloprotease [Pirellulaceae bacterium]|nr:M48 family metalloprotease [Pirellulaceae bacterium]
MAPSPQELLAPLDTPIAPVKLTVLYRIGVVFVAALMVLLPLLYIALIGLVVWGIAWHLRHNAWLLEGPGGLLYYLAPAVLGGLAVCFMFKPLFARPARRPPVFSLDPNHERLLFEFVGRLCHCVGAPVPRRIDVTADANASASFGRGGWGLLRGDVVLTIGLSLAAALSLRQLAGVLAHELGHFTQGSAMRFSHIVGAINRWFGRVVFERDAWDEALLRFSRLHYAFTLLLLPVWLLVWLNRWILWGMMLLAQAVSCFLSRQMEYDADLHEIRVAGSETFERTSWELYVLGHAMARAERTLENSWRQRRLGDDLPALVLASARQFHGRTDQLEEIRQAVLAEKAGLFHTHPATATRIARARREAAAGIYHVEGSATLLFRDFTALCRTLTREYYRELLELEVTADNLVPSADLVAEQQEVDDALETLRCYFQGQVLGVVEIFLPADAQHPPDSPRRTLELLKQSRHRMLAGLPQVRAALERFQAADHRLRELAQQSVLLEAGVPKPHSQLNLPDKSPATLAAARRLAETERAAALNHLYLLAGDARNRLTAGLQLLLVPQIAARLPDAAAHQQRSRRLLPVLRGLEGSWPIVLRLRELAGAIGQLLERIEQQAETGRAVQQVQRLAEHAAGDLRQLRGALAGLPYPFQHAECSITVAEYALPQLPAPDDLPGVLQALHELLEKLLELYYRAMAHVAVIAQHVETAAGLEPLPSPPDEVDSTRPA